MSTPSTNQEVIDAALGKLGIVEAGTAANATDSATALYVLNTMMDTLKYRSMDLNWFRQDDLAATIPLEGWAERPIVCMLAVACATDFRVPVSNDLAREADAGRRLLAGTLINYNLDNTDMSHLPLGQGRSGRYDINTDS